jgi:murein DD-endopeptidase MepM/ murein hydrolase activator NlpD
MHKRLTALLSALALAGLGVAGTAASDARAEGAARALAQPGSLLGTPGVGTHTLGNWQTDNAVDIAAPVGTSVYAVEDGLIDVSLGLGPSGKGGRFTGARLHLRTRDNVWFYAHLSRISVAPGEAVKRGQKIGESGSARGVPHLHLGVQHGDPRALLGL